MKHFRSAARIISTLPSLQLKKFYYDTVNFDLNYLQLAIDFAGVDHILAGSDYLHQIGSLEKMIERKRSYLRREYSTITRLVVT